MLIHHVAASSGVNGRRNPTDAPPATASARITARSGMAASNVGPSSRMISRVM
jgi:hypothetical protein